MNLSLLIKNGLLIDPVNKQESIADLRIEEGMIVEIGNNLQPAHEEQPVLDANHLWLSPGFIDLHTHLRDLGQADAEDIGSGTKAAAKGGFTCVLAMANTAPPIDNPAIFSLYQKKIEETAAVEVLPVANVTKEMKGIELVAMCDLAKMGAAAFSDDGRPISNLAVLRRALEYAKLTDRIIISHAEDLDLSSGGVIHESLKATCLGLPGIPAASEAAAIAAEIEVARQTGGRLHFAHVSCAQSVALIKAAKQSGIAVSADVTPHHLSLTVSDIQSFDTNYKMNPPLRTSADQESLVEALKYGVIDAIATDHAPHPRLEKSRPMDQAPFGIIGLETAFAIANDRLVKRGGMNRINLITLLTQGPAAILGLPARSIKSGLPADLVLIDAQQNWTYDARAGMSKSSNSPFHGRQLTGKILATICQGKLVYTDEQLLKPRLKTHVVSS